MKKMAIGRWFKTFLTFALAFLFLFCSGDTSIRKPLTMVNIDGKIYYITEEQARELELHNEITEDLKNRIILENRVYGDAYICDIDTGKFFYNQLNDIEKEIYLNLVRGRSDFINNKPVFCISYDGEDGFDENYSDYIIRALAAYRADNPESSIWLHYCRSTSDVAIVYDGSGNYSRIDRYEIYLEPEENRTSYSDFEDPKDAYRAIEETERIAQEFVKTLEGSDAEKLRQIHDWLVDGAVYDMSHNEPHMRSIYGAIVNKKSVCAGYAFAFKYVADLAGLNTIYVTGIGTFAEGNTPEAHAWNHVYVNGNWSLVDVTWDINPECNYLFTKIGESTHVPDDLGFDYVLD